MHFDVWTSANDIFNILALFCTVNCGIDYHLLILSCCLCGSLCYTLIYASTARQGLQIWQCSTFVQGYAEMQMCLCALECNRWETNDIFHSISYSY